jgi:hypothetical protein
MKKIILFLFIFTLLSLPKLAFLQNEDFSEGIIHCENDPCSLEEIFLNIRRLLSFAVFIGFWFSVLVSVIGSFLWMFGGPRPDLEKRGKDMIKTAIIGYILLLSVGVIFDFVLEFFGPKLKY